MSTNDTSSIKNLSSEITNLIAESTNLIPIESFYVIKTVVNVNEEILHSFSEIISKCLNFQPKPSACYHSYTELQNDIFELSIILIFPFAEEKHQLNGDHDLMVSKYTYFYSKIFSESNEILTKIIHFESDIQLFMYISWYSYNISRKCMCSHSNGSVTTKEINFRTDNELIDILGNVEGVMWDELSNEEKYGVISKIKKKKGEFVISTISEILDTREYKKYINFIFS